MDQISLFPQKYRILFRVMRCLDCRYPNPNQGHKTATVFHSRSPLNNQMIRMVHILDRKGYKIPQTAKQLQFVYGKNLIRDVRQNGFLGLQERF